MNHREEGKIFKEAVVQNGYLEDLVNAMYSNQTKVPRIYIRPIKSKPKQNN